MYMSANAISKVQGCHIMAKPTGSVCNLDCSYCFYLEKEKLYPERQSNWKMSDTTLTHYIEQYINAQQGPEVEFAWQGGEPTLMGIEFFERVISLQNKFKGNKQIHNVFQTNGVLLNDQWCEFFKKHQILIGISIDGPADLHDAYRVNRSGKPTHHLVMAAIELLKKHRIEFNTLTVINDINAQHPECVYDFLKKIGSTFLQFIPLVEREAIKSMPNGLFLVSPDHEVSSNVTKWSVTPENYGDFLNRVFDLWVTRDVGKIFVQMFDNTLATWCNKPASVCVSSENCGHAFALESNGDLYNCDHYVYPEHKLGNVNKDTIHNMNNSIKAKNFGLEKSLKLSEDCNKCEYRRACFGGCPKHRFFHSSSGKADQNYFCKGYYRFFKHTEHAMKIMAGLLAMQRPASEVMHILPRLRDKIK